MASYLSPPPPPTSREESRRIRPSQWFLVTLAVAFTLVGVLYRLLVSKDWNHTALMFLGLPAVLAIVLALTPKAKSATGGIMKGMTLALLLLAPLLGEGMLCIAIAAPLYYLVGLIVGLVLDRQRKRNARYGAQTLSCVAIVLVPFCLEGTVPNWTVPRGESVAVTRVVAGSPAVVAARLAGSPRFGAPLPLLLRAGFPVPLAAWGTGAAPGSLRTVRFSGAEGAPPGEVVARITESAPGHMHSETVANTTKLAQWLEWTGSDVDWHGVDAQHTAVTWTMHFDRQLDPAWYFGPMERGAVRLAAGYILPGERRTGRLMPATGAIPEWTRAEAVRAVALYGPLLLALAAGVTRAHLPRQPRLFSAALLATLWMLPTLLLMQRLNLAFAWWTFPAAGPASLRGMPLEFYLGWAVLWGTLPVLAAPRLRVVWMAGLVVAADLVLMPLFRPALVLGPRWLVGELVATLLVLLPALVLARATLLGFALKLRAGMQMALATGLFLYWIPEVAFALRPGLEWQPLFALHAWQWQLVFAVAFLLALPGAGAVAEFAGRGGGTPIPYDPPKRLVSSGIYRYVANPMQLSCALVLLLWAAVLHNAFLLLPAFLSVVYSAGLATWDEGEDLQARFGEAWRAYRAAVGNWKPRLTPYRLPGAPATLYYAHGCGPCSQVGRWLLARAPVGLVLRAAEELPAGTTDRLLYVPEDGVDAVRGVRAFGRALEHLHLGWALAGTALRLPGIASFAQLSLDAAGLGPRTLAPAHSLQSSEDSHSEKDIPSCPIQNS